LKVTWLAIGSDILAQESVAALDGWNGTQYFDLVE